MLNKNKTQNAFQDRDTHVEGGDAEEDEGEEESDLHVSDTLREDLRHPNFQLTLIY